jgi:hypothetical protein
LSSTNLLFSRDSSVWTAAASLRRSLLVVPLTRHARLDVMNPPATLTGESRRKTRFPELFVGITLDVVVNYVANRITPSLVHHWALIFVVTQAIFGLTFWLRRKSPKAKLVIVVQAMLLFLGFACAFTAALVPGSWVKQPLLAAALLTAGAVAARADIRYAARPLLGAAIVGIILAFLQGGVRGVIGGDIGRGLQAIAMVAFGSLAGLVLWSNNNRLSRGFFRAVQALSVTAAVILLALGYPEWAIASAAGFFLASYFYKRVPKRGINYRAVASRVGFVRADDLHSEEVPEWVKRQIDRRAVLGVAVGLVSLVAAAVMFLGGELIAGAAFTFRVFGSVLRAIVLFQHGVARIEVGDRFRHLHDEIPERAEETGAVFRAD